MARSIEPLPGGEAHLATACLGNLSERSVNSSFVSHIAESLDWPAWLVEGTSIDPGAPALTLRDALVATANLCDHLGTFEVAVRAMRAPLASLDAHSAMAFQVAPNLDQALGVFARAMAVSAPHLSIDYGRDRRAGTIEVRSEMLDGRLFDAVAMATLALCYRLAENLAGKVAFAARLSLTASGIRQHMLAQELLCPIRFGADGNRMIIPAPLLTDPNPRHDPILWELLRRPRRAGPARQEVASDSSLTGRIRRDLATSRRLPRLKQIASALHLSERTIVRQLHGEGTSFRQLVDDERMRRAVRLLNDRSIELARVADLLGFADAPSFWRTFRRWFGVTPTEFRQ